MLARESKEHGIDELCLWDWNLGLQVPIPPPYPSVGTEKDLVNAVAECKRLGVNVNLFISVMGLANPSARSYGLTPPRKAAGLITPSHPPVPARLRQGIVDRLH